MKASSFPTEVIDHSVSKESFNLRFNDSLQAVQTCDVPEDLARFYDSPAYISHTDSNNSIVDKVYGLIRRIMILRKVALLRSRGRKVRTTLDIGAGTGAFVKALRQRGIAAEGVEPNFKARQNARAKGVELFESVSEVQNQKFDAITMWHVLEHIPNPKEHLAICSEMLSEGGVLIIAVPNYQSYDAQHYGGFWAAFDVPRHLWHFNRMGMQSLLENTGFTMLSAKPMMFDAFYIALLSEKYKTGKANFFKAFIIGLLSNFKALSTKEFSSVIYVAEKSKTLF